MLTLTTSTPGSAGTDADHGTPGGQGAGVGHQHARRSRFASSNAQGLAPVSRQAVEVLTLHTVRQAVTVLTLTKA